MPKLILGKTSEEIAAEEALKQREREVAIQQEMLDRQQKVIELHNAQKRNKIIIIAVISVAAISLITFGTYNTFFKKGLQIGQVQAQIASNVNYFPEAGLDNFIRDACEPLFFQSVSYDRSAYEWVDVVEDSVYISRVRTASNNLAEVYFSVDVTMKPVDVLVTDQAVIDRLYRNGFANEVETTPETTETTPAETTPPETTPEETVPAETTPEETQPVENAAYTFGNDEPQLVNLAFVNEPETVDPTTDEGTGETEETTDPLDDTEMGSIDIKNNNTGDEEIEYYVVGNGSIYQRSQPVTVRYNFYLPVEFYYNYDSNNNPITSGYRAASNLNLYVLNEVNQTDFSSIAVNSAYSFESIEEADEQSNTAARIKVDKILGDLYSGRDTSQDFFNYRSFNTYGASYVRLVSFQLYNGYNGMGYNCEVSYSIQMPQGIQYTVHSYMIIEPVGSGQEQTWKITAIT